ncbi:hypothetical protein T4C_10909, partial [Trichinella pseudospiralis]
LNNTASSCRWWSNTGASVQEKAADQVDHSASILFHRQLQGPLCNPTKQNQRCQKLNVVKRCLKQRHTFDPANAGKRLMSTVGRLGQVAQSGQTNAIGEIQEGVVLLFSIAQQFFAILAEELHPCRRAQVRSVGNLKRTIVNLRRRQITSPRICGQKQLALVTKHIKPVVTIDKQIPGARHWWHFLKMKFHSFFHASKFVKQHSVRTLITRQRCQFQRLQRLYC